MSNDLYNQEILPLYECDRDHPSCSVLPVNRTWRNLLPDLTVCVSADPTGGSYPL